MALLLKNGAIFLHIPKTGGSWVSRVLWECDLVEKRLGYKHDDFRRALYPQNYQAQASRVIKRLPSKVAEKVGLKPLKQNSRKSEEFPYTFCFVRHPLSWYESFFKFQQSLGWPYWGNENDYTETWHPNAMLNGLGDQDFNQFVCNVIDKRPGYVTEMYGWYTPPSISFVGKQENLVYDLIQILSKLNVEFDKGKVLEMARGHVNSSPKTLINWDEYLKKKVEELEHISLLRYGYTNKQFSDT
ncbi:MAG: hypothetical protein BRC41_19550 [Cyanobacteria bacterium QH_9_48_43]|nr:MAG: hypothetical protein BRC41_19550 [Cyanobacteria bacterium QH_9_48_43]